MRVLECAVNATASKRPPDCTLLICVHRMSRTLQEAELRTLKAAAQDVAAKFDAAVAALASRRLDVLGEVSGSMVACCAVCTLRDLTVA